mmetsp:Transcript_34750/g.106755  ORF Transcript_34750/g.106755 Transcript_34750/m.106755 type:complete len:209 (-) Transcript_34750:227-853(-)
MLVLLTVRWLNDPNQMRQLSIDRLQGLGLSNTGQDYVLALSTLDDECWSCDMVFNGSKKEWRKNDEVYDEMMCLLENPARKNHGSATTRNDKKSMQIPRRIAPRPVKHPDKKDQPAILPSDASLITKRAEIGEQLLALTANRTIDEFTLMCAHKVLATADSFIMDHVEDALRSLPGDDSKLMVLLSIHASLQQHINSQIKPGDKDTVI